MRLFRPRIFKLAAGQAGESPLRLWPLAAGIALGIATWIFFSGFASGLSQLLREKVAGSRPDRIRVASSSTQFGPIQLGGGMNADTVEACRKIAGVETVFRQAHFPGPVQLTASYGGQSVLTDIILDGVDVGQVSDSLDRESDFKIAPEFNGEIPAVIPETVLDVLNAGISAHTSLPTLSPSALRDKHFKLMIGVSSYMRQANPTEADCRIVGVSDQLGVNGPAVPYDWLEKHSEKPLKIHTLTLKLKDGAPLEPVLIEVRRLGLVAPGVEMSSRIDSLTAMVQVATALFCGCILLLAGACISTGMALQIRQERWLLGLFRALGATPNDILAFVIYRSLILTSMGTTLGLAAGWIAGTVTDLWIRQSFAAVSWKGPLYHNDWRAWAVAIGAGLLSGLFSGAWPAKQASALPPAEALRGD